MASRRQIWRRGFDERYDFVALRELRFTSGTVRVGEVLDKSLTTPRRLRQLYEARWIDVAKPAGPGVTYPSTLAPEAPETVAPLPSPELPPEPEAAPAPEYVPLPSDWRDRSAMDIRRMAEALTGEKYTSRADAMPVLEDYDRARPA